MFQYLQETNKEIDEYSHGEFFSIKLNLKDKHQEDIKLQQEESAARMAELQEEADRLRMQVS